MPSPNNSIDSLDDFLDKVNAKSKARAPLILLGLVLLLSSFLYFAVSLNTALNNEVQARQAAERRANQLANTLEQARAAYTGKEFRAVGILVNRALNQAERSAQQAQATENQDLVLPVANTTSTTSTILPTTVSGKPYPQPVYIQFAGLLERAQIVALNRNLKAAGWDVRGQSGERTARAAGLNEVRYAGNNRSAAQALAQTITETQLTKPLTIRKLAVVKNNLEVWISLT